MTERQLLQGLTKQITAELDDVWWYKIPDSPMKTTAKPLDVVACYNGRFFGIEFKKEGGKLTENQIKNLKGIQNVGGKAFVGTFIYNGKHERNIIFQIWWEISGPPYGACKLYYNKGRYKKIHDLFFMLDNLF